MQPRFSHLSIKVVGVGGAGCNAVGQMIEDGVEGVEFLNVDTDPVRLQPCSESGRITSLAVPFRRGFVGDGPIPGARAAEAAERELLQALGDADLVLVVAGMGGRTGTGAAPVVARVVREEGWALVVAAVTMPFSFEGRRRREAALQGIAALQEAADTVIVIPNDGLLPVVGRQTLAAGLKTVDRLLRRTVQAVVEVLTVPGLIDLDFADLRQMMLRRGLGVVGLGHAEGEGRAIRAAMAALSSPLLGIPLDRAASLLSIVRCGPDLEFHRVVEAQELVSCAAHPEATILFAVNVDPRLVGAVEVTLVAAGIDTLPALPLPPNAREVEADLLAGRVSRVGERTEELVRSVLGGEEYDRLLRLGYLEVPSRHYRGRLYRIPSRPGTVEVLEGGKVVARLCVVSTEPIPPGEMVLVHKLMIEGSEQEYLRVARRLR